MTERQRYFEKAREWAADTRARESRAMQAAWIIAGLATAIALFEAVALALLTPLKTVQQVTVLVDRQTGYVQALDPLHPPKITADAALTQSFLAQYVAAREGFDRATVSRDYQRVALWSAGPARAQYLALMPASNPRSPLQRFANGFILHARVKSVSRLADGVALVRFAAQLQDRSGQTQSAQSWISVVRYHYSDAPMTFENRLVNPLGFQVTSYRRDAEAPAVTMAEQPTDKAGPGAAPANFEVAPSTQQPAVSYDRPMASRGVALNRIPLGSPLMPRGGAPVQTGQGGLR